MREDPAVASLIGSCLLALALAAPAEAQEKKPKAPPTPGPMLEQGTIDLDTPDFTLTLVRSSQTVAALKPKDAGGFDFTPGDLLVERSQNGYFHLGDIDLRLRSWNLGRVAELFDLQRACSGDGASHLERCSCRR